MMELSSLRSLSSAVLAIWCFLAWNIPTTYAAEENVEERTRTIGKQLTAIKLIETTIQELSKSPIDVDALKAEMINSPSEYKRKRESEKSLMRWYTEYLKAHLDSELSRIYKMKIVSREWLEERVNSQFGEEISSSIERVVFSNEFPKAFKHARVSVVKEQWRNVTIDIYPSPDEVEHIIENGAIAKNKIEKKLKRDMSDKVEVLFEENERDLEKEIGRIINHALSQYRSQENLVDTYKAKGYFTEGAIFKELIDRLNGHIKSQKQKAKENEKVYNAFTSLVERASKRAIELEAEKFREYILSNETSSLIDQDKIKRLIEKNLEEHRNFSQCFEKLQEKLIPDTKAKIIMGYSRKTGEVDNTDFQKKLNRLLAGDLRVDANNAIKDGLKGPIKKIRDQLAAQQLQGYFPQIISQEWKVPESYIIKFKDKGKEIGTNELAKLLATKTIEEIKLLEEAEKELDKIKKGLLEEGNRALLRQEGIVHNLKDEIQDTLQREILGRSDHTKLNASRLHKVYKKRAIELYITHVEDIWGRERVRLIWPSQEHKPYMKNKYVKLFKHTKDEIEKTITPDFFEELELQEEPEIVKKPQEIPKKEQIGIEASEESRGPGELEGQGPGGLEGQGPGGRGVASFLKKVIPWLLIAILAILLLTLLGFLIWWLIKKRQRKERSVVGKGKLIFIIEDTNFRREFEYPKGETDSESVKVAFKKIWESLKL